MARSAAASATTAATTTFHPRPPSKHRNLELKIAIIRSRRSQREIAREAAIAEGRLSDIVTGRGTLATPDEQKALARVLRCSVRSLFEKSAA